MDERSLSRDEISYEHEAWISTKDPGWRFGQTLFETIPVYQGVPYLMEEHWIRIQRSASLLGMRIPLDPRQLREAMERFPSSQDKVLFRLTVSSSGAWSLVGRTANPGVESYRRGWRVTLFPPILNNRPGFWGTIKTGNYWGVMESRKILGEREADEGLFITREGELLEGSFTNVFLGKEERLWTPWLSSRVLAGVTRQRVLDLLRGFMSVGEGRLNTVDLWKAEEGFLCGAGAEILPIRMIEGRLLPAGAPGPMTLRVMKRFAEDVYERTKGVCMVARSLCGLLD